MPEQINRYLCKVTSPYSLSSGDPALLEPDWASFVVVIPVLGESENLPSTLQSLAQLPANQREKLLIILVVNNRASHDEFMKQDNLRVLEWLKAGRWQDQLQLAWVDCASPGCELPPKRGVGLARKIGFDLALTVGLDEVLLFSLDADTLVEGNYISAALDAFDSLVDCGFYPVRHQESERADLQEAVEAYELYLERYTLGLRSAGSPYAYSVYGSALAFTGEAYALADGMPAKRLAGEDFYFMQNLAKHLTIKTLDSTVHPSARLSVRTPFGTGQRLLDFINEGSIEKHQYHQVSFEALKELIDSIKTHQTLRSAEEVLSHLSYRPVADFLMEEGFESVWTGICQNHARSHANRLKAFHNWFDALKTLRLLHYLEDRL